jgi:hypothetical protein
MATAVRPAVREMTLESAGIGKGFLRSGKAVVPLPFLELPGVQPVVFERSSTSFRKCAGAWSIRMLHAALA